MFVYRLLFQHRLFAIPIVTASVYQLYFLSDWYVYIISPHSPFVKGFFEKNMPEISKASGDLSGRLDVISSWKLFLPQEHLLCLRNRRKPLPSGTQAHLNHMRTTS